MTNITTNSRVRIENRGDGWDGVTATVTQDTGDDAYLLEADTGLNPLGQVNIGSWSLHYLTAIEAPKVGLPTIDFSTPSRKTARDYAAVLQSRVIDEKHNKTLQRVQFGAEDVDALALNEALLAAMRSGATRFGQSMARRDFTSKVAHLGYIVQAVLENHANLLPPYEGGPRSPRIASLEAVVNKHQSYIGDLEKQVEDERANLRCAKKLWDEERSSLTQAASDERRRLVGEIDVLRCERNELSAAVSEATAVLNRTLDTSTERDNLLAETVRERDTLGAVLAYALEDQDAEYVQRIHGYWDGLLDGTGQDRD